MLVRTCAAIFSILLVLFFEGELCAQSNSLPTFFSLPGNLSGAHHTQAKLILSAAEAKPGDTIFAGVDLKMDPGWHTYWKNSGDAGAPTEIKWQLPPGISAGQIEWPLPKKLPPIEVTTYGYEDEVVLIVPLKIETNFPAGEIDLKANVSWLECKDVCIPASQNVEAKLIVGSEAKTSADSAMIDLWKRKVPQTNNYGFQAWWEKPANGDTRPLLFNDGSPNAAAEKNVPYSSVDFFPDVSDTFEVQAPTEIISSWSSYTRFRKVVKKFSGDWPKEISGLIVIEEGGSRFANEVKLPITDQSPTGETISSTQIQPLAFLPPPLWQMLLYAFIGGLILNIMPCVLPVIALKILGFVGEARSEPRRVRNLGFIYALGVLISFLALAGIVIGVKAAGYHAGWGMQFGNPIFVVCLTTLVTLVALNLFGVFEITPSGKILNAAGTLASRHGAGGAFFNGFLATALATPCTAPFLAPALGFAFAQNASTIILIFLFVGLGLAAPYVLLSCNPALLKFLPKPGAWMEKFKIAMGFPMLMTAVWLFNVAASSYGKNVLWLGIFLVVVAFAAWVFGEFFQRGRAHKGISLALVLILFAGGYFFILEDELNWRNAMPEANSGSLQESANGIDWQPWSPEAVAQARAAGKIVLVDFTATWCVTCNAIVKPALENNSVAAELKKINAATFLADYTRTPPAITDELAKYQSAGVPLVLVFPKNSDASAIILPQPSPFQLPSSFSKVVLDALDRAAK